MAITNNTLKTLTFSGNNNVIVATSTNNNQPNFRLSVKVELWNGTTYDVVTSQLVPKRPDNNIVYNLEGVFRAIAVNSLSQALQISLLVQLSTLFQIRVTLQEYYGSTPSLQGATSQQVIRVLPATFNEYKFSAFTPNDILVTAANAGKWLKTVTSQSLRLDQHFTLENITNIGSGTGAVIQIKTYDFSGVLIDTYNLSSLFLENAFYRNSVLLTLNSLNALTLSSGTQPIITDNVNSVTFSVTTANTPPFQVLIDRSCSKFDIYTLFWANSFGALESLACTGRPISSFENERETAFFDSGDVSGGNWVEDNLNGGTETIYTMQKKVFRLNTGLLSANDMLRLSEIGKSRYIAIKIGSDVFNCELLTLPFQIDSDFPNPTNYSIDVAISKVIEN